MHQGLPEVPRRDADSDRDVGGLFECVAEHFAGRGAPAVVRGDNAVAASEQGHLGLPHPTLPTDRRVSADQDAAGEFGQGVCADHRGILEPRTGGPQDLRRDGDQCGRDGGNAANPDALLDAVREPGTGGGGEGEVGVSTTARLCGRTVVCAEDEEGQEVLWHTAVQYGEEE